MSQSGGDLSQPTGNDASVEGYDQFTIECMLALEKAVELLDHFDLYASVEGDPTPYNESPFQADVRAFLDAAKGGTDGR